MAIYEGPNLQIVWNGYLAGGQDIWQTGLFLGPLTLFDGSSTPGQTLVQSAYDLMASTMFGTQKAKYAEGTVLTGCKLYYRDTVGGPATIEWEAETDDPQPAGTGTQALPSECAIVVSTLTGLPGRSRRGRAYLPGLSSAVLQAGGFLEVAAVGALLDAYQAILEGLNSTEVSGAPIAECMVLSRTLNEGRTITQIKIGNVMDSQRRRRNAIIEDYQTATIAGA